MPSLCIKCVVHRDQLQSCAALMAGFEHGPWGSEPFFLLLSAAPRPLGPGPTPEGVERRLPLSRRCGCSSLSILER